MRFHNITHDDMKNGDGLRVVLWLSGCTHHCDGCQNPITWNPDVGVEFDKQAKQEIFNQLDKDYISGITFSGGDPLHDNNILEVKLLINDIKEKYKTKTIWIYTGYTYNDLMCLYPEKYEIVKMCNVLVDGEFIQEMSDVNYHWAGSVNQNVIDIQKSLEEGKVILWK